MCAKECSKTRKPHVLHMVHSLMLGKQGRVCTGDVLFCEAWPFALALQLMYADVKPGAQEDEYLQTATMYYDKLNSWKADNYAYDWDNKSPALHVLLTQIFPSEMMK